MITIIDDPAFLSNVTSELGDIAVACQKYNLVCTEQAEFTKYTYAIAIFGMILGVICILLYQYTRKKAAEIVAKKEADEAAEEADQDRK